MKKIYSYLMALVALVICAVTANADNVKVTLKIDNPDNVTVTKDGYVGQDWVSDQPVELTGAETIFECAQWGSVHVNPKDGYLIVSSKVDGIDRSINYGVTISSDCLIEVTTGSYDELQTGSFKLTVDDPSKIQATLMKCGVIENLQPGENIVKYIPELDKEFIVRSTSYSLPLYKVTCNGEPATDNWGAFSFVPTEGMEIVALANYPDEDELVTFSYNEGAEGCITKVYIGEGNDKIEVDDFNKGFNVKCGQKITFEGNDQAYKFISVTANGNPVSFYSSGEVLIKEPTTIAVVAEKYAMTKVHVVVDDASRVVLYNGSIYSNIIFDNIKDGDNEVEVSAKDPKITVTCTPLSIITSVKVGDQEVEKNYSGNYEVSITEEGMVLTITSEAAKTLKFTVYTTKPGLSIGSGSSRFEIEEAGYTEVEIREDAYPVSIYPPYNYDEGYKDAFFYIDDVLQGDGAQYFLSFTPDCDNCVLKAYSEVWDPTPETTLKPALHKLTFEVDEAVKGSFSVIRDKVKDVDTAVELNTLAGTLVEIIPSDALGARVLLPALSVTVGDKDVVADENGVYSFSVDGDAKVSIKQNPEAGAGEIESVESAAHAVYNLQGIKVLDNAEGINGLPSGVYIVNGKKVMK